MTFYVARAFEDYHRVTPEDITDEMVERACDGWLEADGMNRPNAYFMRAALAAALARTER